MVREGAEGGKGEKRSSAGMSGVPDLELTGSQPMPSPSESRCCGSGGKTVNRR